MLTISLGIARGEPLGNPGLRNESFVWPDGIRPLCGMTGYPETEFTVKSNRNPQNISPLQNGTFLRKTSAMGNTKKKSKFDSEKSENEIFY